MHSLIIGDQPSRCQRSTCTVSAGQFNQQLLSIKGGSYDLARIREINKLANYPIANKDIAKVVLEKLKLN